MFATTWGPCAWVVIGEIFPLSIRFRGVGHSNHIQLVLELHKFLLKHIPPMFLHTRSPVIGVMTPYLVGADHANLRSNIFFMWGYLCIISVLYAYFLVLETKGLSLEQVDKMMEEGTPRKSQGGVPHSTFAANIVFLKRDSLFIVPLSWPRSFRCSGKQGSRLSRVETTVDWYGQLPGV